ncbi:MAG: hypothetical protein RLZZ303_590 [Candidatus Hydrogenedentota bacterium]|jgi:mono/diheme cytochrome c family protein
MRVQWNAAWQAAMVGCVLAGSMAAQAEPVKPSRIRTILEAKCVGCHGAENPKAGLRLDAPEHIGAGGSSGPALVAAKPEESLIVQRISLPDGDEDLMPPKGGPLPKKDIEAITQWIAEGASFEGWAEEYKEPQIMFASLSVGKAAAPLYAEDALKKLAEGLAPAAPEAIAAATQSGVRLAPLDQTSPLLQADLKFVPEGATDAHLAALAPVAQNITWLNLAGSKVTDAGLAALAGMPRLTSIHLERTGITDAGVAQLAGLSNLEYLNFFGTQVTDASVETLKALPKLRRLYAWQSGMTLDGANALTAANPLLAVNMGTEQKPLEEMVYNDPEEDLKKMQEGQTAALFDPFKLTQE